jgi:acyl phosphate:glycerol-3-phosphate acyltransferase
VSYLLGSIPFGYLLVRIFTGEDVRASGSGNIGATNVARKSPALGVATLLLDAAKGLAAVLVARALFSGPHQQLIMTTAAFFAVLGHLFPVWLKFRGGKGVATSLGAFILLTPKSILCMVGCFCSSPSPSATSRSGPSLWRRLFRCWHGLSTNTRTRGNCF